MICFSNVSRKYLFVFISLQLVACGGGGGGGGGSITVTTNSFSGTYDSVDLNMSGSSLASYSNQSSGSLTTTTKVRSDSLISYAKFSTAAGDKTFDTDNGASIATFTSGAIGMDSTGDGVIFHLDSYSGYGIWEITTGNQSRVFVGQAGTNRTSNPAAVVPSASYSGYALGILSEVGYSPIFTDGTFSAIANFASGSMNVSTSNTRGISLSGVDLGSYATENFSGTLSKSGANNYTYSGTITNGYSGSGTATVNVYGPSANSVAGSAILTKSDGTRKHAVSFGGTRN